MKSVRCLAVLCFAGFACSLNASNRRSVSLADLDAMLTLSPEERLEKYGDVDAHMQKTSEALREIKGCQFGTRLLYERVAIEGLYTSHIGEVLSMCILGYLSDKETVELLIGAFQARKELVERQKQARERLAQEFERLSQKRQQVSEVSNKSDTEE